MDIDPYDITIEDVVEAVGGYAMESEYIMSTVYGILTLYTEQEWSYAAAKFDPNSGYVVYSFVDIDNPEDEKTIEFDIMRITDNEYVDDTIENFAYQINKGSVGRHNVRFH